MLQLLFDVTYVSGKFGFQSLSGCSAILRQFLKRKIIALIVITATSYSRQQ